MSPSSPSVHVITLLHHLGSYSFAELSRIEGSSHVMMLQGKFVGCALRNDAMVPHIVDWVANEVYDLPAPPPSLRDAPERRCAPHLWVIWNGRIVVVRQTLLELFNLPSADRGPVYIKSVRTIEMWEVVVLAPPPLSASLQLLVISPRGLELITLHPDIIMDDSVHHSTNTLLAETANAKVWYNLTASGQGRRAIWFRITNGRRLDPHLVALDVNREANSEAAPLRTWLKDPAEVPSAALWAFPSLDFDEALGLTVLGNSFGEIVVHDHVQSDPVPCCGLAPDVTYRQALSSPILLSQEPIPLGPPHNPIDPTITSTSVSDWATEHHHALNPALWSTNLVLGHYGAAHRWLGALGDWAWLLTHASHLPGRVALQVYGCYEPEDQVSFLIVRAGDVLLLHAGPEEVRSFRAPGLGDGLVWHNTMLQPCMRPSAFTVAHVYERVKLRREWVREYGSEEKYRAAMRIQWSRD
ncbi:hypothetical protein DFH06DRAFT_1330452 [Mycena polygramma]|nr:hypothetical protein DFH06DRAFT_1369448 [Mycena polygramma]KAJ7653736.1 hypothetical protein DFH06DRAFT_1330452 [Mycena polygramma]